MPPSDVALAHVGLAFVDFGLVDGDTAFVDACLGFNALDRILRIFVCHLDWILSRQLNKKRREKRRESS